MAANWHPSLLSRTWTVPTLTYPFLSTLGRAHIAVLPTSDSSQYTHNDSIALAHKSNNMNQNCYDDSKLCYARFDLRAGPRLFHISPHFVVYSAALNPSTMVSFPSPIKLLACLTEPSRIQLIAHCNHQPLSIATE